MSADRNRIIRFWNELKRRKVVRVMTVYAATSYIILEASDIVLPRLGLPDWTVTFLIVLIIAGFPVVIVLSWIFDLTPEGIQKTAPGEETTSAHTNAQKAPESSVEYGELASSTERSRKRVATSSNIIIGLLLVAVGILVVPNFFRNDQLEEFRDEEGMISLAVLPFDNLTGDSSLYFWQNGISEYLINSLGNSEELKVSSSQVISDVLAGTREISRSSLAPEIAQKTADKINASTYVTGNFMGAGNDYSILLNLINTVDGEILWSTRIDGDLVGNYRSVLQHLADTVRNHMEIKALEEAVEKDLSNAFPNSSEAYRFYIEGLNDIMDGNYDLAIESLKSAYEIDTTFTFAAFYTAFAHSFGGQFNEELLYWTRRSYELKDNLPPVYRPWIEIWYACYISKNYEDIRRNCDRLMEAAVHSRFLLFDLAVTYTEFLDEFEIALQAYERIESLNELWNDPWRYNKYYREYTETMLLAGHPEKVARIADIGLSIDPENGMLIVAKASAANLLNDSAAEQKYHSELISFMRDHDFNEASKAHTFGAMYRWAGDYIQAAEAYRRAFELDNTRLWSLMYLITCQLESETNLEECLLLSDYGIEIWPDHFGPYWMKGKTLHKLSRHQEARSLLREGEKKAKFGGPREMQDDIIAVEKALAAASSS